MKLVSALQIELVSYTFGGSLFVSKYLLNTSKVSGEAFFFGLEAFYGLQTDLVVCAYKQSWLPKHPHLIVDFEIYTISDIYFLWLKKLYQI